MEINLTPICMFRKWFQTRRQQKADSLSSGIDSFAVGKTEILGEMKKKWSLAPEEALMSEGKLDCGRANTDKDWGSRRTEGRKERFFYTSLEAKVELLTLVWMELNKRETGKPVVAHLPYWFCLRKKSTGLSSPFQSRSWLIGEDTLPLLTLIS